MQIRSGKHGNAIRLMIVLAWSSGTAWGQAVPGMVESISGAGTVYTEATHTRLDSPSGSESNTRPGAGIEGHLGGRLQSGASSLALRYGGSLDTRRKLPDGETTDSSSVNGNARYQYFDRANPLDFNLGHSVRSVRNNTGFLLDAGEYDTRNTLSGGAGLTLLPGDLSSVRFSAQAGRSYGGEDIDDSKSFTVSGELSRRLSERSEAVLAARRSWSEEQAIDTTIDNAELGYQLALEHGSFSLGVGASQSQRDFQGEASVDGEAATGHISRFWTGVESSTRLEYTRRLSDSTTDLSLDLPPDLTFLPDTIQLQDLVVSDALQFTHHTEALCNACRFSVMSEAVMLESEITNQKTHEYRASFDLAFEFTRLQTLSAGYGWQGDAGENSGTVLEQRHTLNIAWNRRLTAKLRFGTELRQTWVRSKSQNRDQERYGIRLFLTRNFGLMARR